MKHIKRYWKHFLIVVLFLTLLVLYFTAIRGEKTVYTNANPVNTTQRPEVLATDPTGEQPGTDTTEEQPETQPTESYIEYELSQLSASFSSYGGENDEDYIFVKENYHDIVNGKTDHLYGLYDALVEQYPEYITRTQIATTAEPVLPVYWDENGERERTEISADTVFPIYRYDFCLSDDEGGEKPKILYISGIHGGEYQQVFAAYRFFRMLCNEWQEEPLLQELYENVHFVVIPLANPFGFNFPSGRYTAEGINVAKRNERNIDISGNFPSENYISGTDQMYGTEPLTEPGSQAIYKIICEEEFILSIDNHTYGFLATEYEDDATQSLKHMAGYFITDEETSFWHHVGNHLNDRIRVLSPAMDETTLTQSDGTMYSYGNKELFYLVKEGKNQMLCTTFRGISANMEMVLSIDPVMAGYSDGATPYMPLESQAFLVDQLAVVFYEAYLHLS
ncbi:MAG: hypothetical protein IJ453_00300 [Oscillospiraceae bacterium]|nr:hypothetical protein [Oscillospiraceae bacterium]